MFKKFNRIVFDIETNGLLYTMDKIHCIVLHDLDSGQTKDFSGEAVRSAVKRLEQADEIIGHNIIGFDIPAIQLLYPDFKPEGKVIDTLVISRLIYTTLADMDSIVIKRQLKRNKKPYSKRLVGSHGLEAWGHRLGFHKGDYASECKDKGIDPWESFNDDMLSYCINDVELNVHLYRKFLSKKYSQRAIDLEHEVLMYCNLQTKFGVSFDMEKATKLYGLLCEKRTSIQKDLVETFGSWLARGKEFTPKRDNKRLGYKEGCTFTKLTQVEFNPNSTQHIANRLQKEYNWKPKIFTPSGLPQVNEKILKDLKYPEIPKLMEFLLVNKRISQLAEGKSAWLKVVRDGKIHGRVNPMGTISGRASHSDPNLGQVVAVRSPYGVECRECFIPAKGSVFVGADASGIELRCLAHYMAKWDGGAYVQEILTGDIHSKNQEAAGLPTRDHAKTFIYGLLYGAGDGKIGEIIGKGAAAGKVLRAKFMKALPAYKNLTERVKKVAEAKGYLVGLDGRHLIIRAAHAALNQLLQGAGAVIMKQATLNYHEILKNKGLVLGKDYRQVLWIHDEWQCECTPGLEDIVGQAMVDGIKKCTEDFNFKCPLDGEYKTGSNWAETH